MRREADIIAIYMQRANPYLSLPGILLAMLFVGGLIVSTVVAGGSAFSPGALTARTANSAPLQGFTSHADFERQCKLCHQPLTSDQASLCLACHQEISAQLEPSSEGLHGQMSQVRHCFACHPDHRGRDYSPAEAALFAFDHSLTHFSLVHHALDYSLHALRCEACHPGGKRDQEVILTGCLECHARAEPGTMAQHEQEFGRLCLDCHDGADRMLSVEHQKTDFPLEGQHAEARCAACHQNGKFEGTPLLCQDCHEEPGLHRGTFLGSCQDCHTVQSWSPVSWDGSTFSHEQSGFSLVQHRLSMDGVWLTCLGCHPADLPFQSLDEIPPFDPVTCQDCHKRFDPDFYSIHLSQVGDVCLACHDGTDQIKEFDHQQVFSLDGAHAGIGCLDCHQTGGTVIYRGLSSDCFSCHAEPEIHAGTFGVACQDCHTTSAWRPALLLKHSFPLDHGGAASTCQSCHPANYIAYTCYGCHDHQPAEIAQEHAEENIVEPELSTCTTCHPQGQKDEE